MSSTLRKEIRKRVKSDLRVFFGYDETDEIRKFQGKNEPFLYMDHAYFDRGYERGNFRVIYNTIHRTNVLDVPDDRRKKFKTTLKEWRKGEKILFIPAPKNPLWFHRDRDWNDWALQKLLESTDREIVVKKKKTIGLGDSIHNCYALVTHSSVAGVEAACNGIRVVGPNTSPAYPVGVEIDKINDLIEPDRTKWVNTLCYSQFTLDELSNGTCWQIIKETENL